MSDGKMPPDLASVLRAARELERAARSTRQWHAAIQANSRLLLACVNAGWMVTEIGRALGIDRHAASKRLQAARREYGDENPGGLVVPSPPPKEVPVSPLAILYTPVEGRDWLSAPEAMEYAGISYGSLTAWRKHGLLPNTRWLYSTRALYKRSDLRRVMRGRRTARGVDHAAARGLIDAHD